MSLEEYARKKLRVHGGKSKVMGPRCMVMGDRKHVILNGEQLLDEVD